MCSCSFTNKNKLKAGVKALFVNVFLNLLINKYYYVETQLIYVLHRLYGPDLFATDA